jgi:uncharacterized membrane protein YphA (DoxX/SURF4 family)
VSTDITVRFIRLGVASVWLLHGLYNKLLGGSPRHLAIVQSVPGLAGASGARVLTAVGLFEVGIGLWVLSGRRLRLCAAIQTIVLLSMNIVELTFARPLLLWPAGLVPVNLLFLGAMWIAAAPERFRIRAAPAWLRRLCVRLRRHPFAIDAHLRDCITLTYALPAAALRPLLPPGLELDTVGDDGFVAVALVQAQRLRPAGVPPALGRDFFLAGYRIFTRFRQPDGRSIRGLRILRSDADRDLMVAGGNLLTHYNYHRCDAAVAATADRLHVGVSTPDHAGDLDIDVNLRETSLPAGSPFASVREARRFAGPLPFTFDYEPETHAIVAIEARRTNWRPAPVGVRVGRLSFFDQPAFAGVTPRLAAAFHVSGVDYQWGRGVRHALGAIPREVTA